MTELQDRKIIHNSSRCVLLYWCSGVSCLHHFRLLHETLQCCYIKHYNDTTLWLHLSYMKHDSDIILDCYMKHFIAVPFVSSWYIVAVISDYDIILVLISYVKPLRPVTVTVFPGNPSSIFVFLLKLQSTLNPLDMHWIRGEKTIAIIDAMSQINLRPVQKWTGTFWITSQVLYKFNQASGSYHQFMQSCWTRNFKLKRLLLTKRMTPPELNIKLTYSQSKQITSTTFMKVEM